MQPELPQVDQLRKLAELPPERSFSLPPACYTDPRFFALELQKVFDREWLCIGRASDMPEAGDYLTLDTAAARVMAVRQKDGTISVMSRVCRHRGALLGVESGGNAKAFVCPYHNWTYELDGRLRGAPAMATNPAFDRESCSLPRFKTETWEGFVFFTANTAAPPLAQRLADVSERIRRYRLSELKTAFVINDQWNTNWKVAFENGTETYHHMGVHKDTLQPVFPTLGTRCELGGEAYSLHVVPARPGFTLDDDDSKDRANDLHGSLTHSELSELLIIGVYPGLALVFAGPSVTWFIFTPIDVTRTTLRVGWSVSAQFSRRPDFDELMARNRDFLEAVLAEDKASCASVQHGLSARDAVAGPLSELELTVAQFGRYLARSFDR